MGLVCAVSMQRAAPHSLDAVDEGSVAHPSPPPMFSAAAYANHTYPTLPSELLIRTNGEALCDIMCDISSISLFLEPTIVFQNHYWMLRSVGTFSCLPVTLGIAGLMALILSGTSKCNYRLFLLYSHFAIIL